MTGPEVFDIAREALFVTLKISAPVLITALVIGLAVSIVQALTQVQETTLSFVPKAITIGAVFLLTMPFMIATLISFTRELAARMVQGG
jgi:flagellar biosynthesis protein FliQ